VKLKCEILEESNLFFGGNNSTIDPKVGLNFYGPYGSFGPESGKSITIKAGVISTFESLNLLKIWLNTLKHRITGRIIEDSDVRSIDFPGISSESPLNFEIHLVESAIENISKEDLEKALSSESRDERILKIIDIYKEKFQDMATNHPSPDIILLPLDEQVIEKCKNPRDIQDKIVFRIRTFDKKNIQPDEIPLFDFHNYLKVLGIKHHLVSQVIRPSTLIFSHKNQDEATVAWNVAVALYYKGTGIPWKIAEIDEETCYVGISFYQEISKNEQNMNTSMAHVYLKTGESQIVQGNSFYWDSQKGRSPHLSEENSQQIIERIISVYKRQRGKNPKRLVIHKSSPFSDEEISGFKSSSANIEVSDFIHIDFGSSIRAFINRYSYPPLRGTIFGINTTWFLYTVGYVPSLGTYPGATIPKPLKINFAKSDSHYKTIGQDIMALTKMDWNTADYCRREPVTLSVSRKVGDILSELRGTSSETPPENYKFYM